MRGYRGAKANGKVCDAQLAENKKDFAVCQSFNAGTPNRRVAGEDREVTAAVTY